MGDKTYLHVLNSCILLAARFIKVKAEQAGMTVQEFYDSLTPEDYARVVKPQFPYSIQFELEKGKHFRPTQKLDQTEGGLN